MTWTAPKTWAVGDPGTSSDLNTYVRDNAKFLYGDVAWTAATLQNGWVVFGATNPVPGYRLDGAHVELRGAAKNGTLAGGTLLFTLPVGYRPALATSTVGLAAGASFFGINISNAGAVTIAAGASATAIQFDGMRFSTIA